MPPGTVSFGAALVQRRRAGLHRLVHVRDMGQGLVIDLDELDGALGHAGLEAATAATACPS